MHCDRRLSSMSPETKALCRSVYMSVQMSVCWEGGLVGAVTLTSSLPCPLGRGNPRRSLNRDLSPSLPCSQFSQPWWWERVKGTQAFGKDRSMRAKISHTQRAPKPDDSSTNLGRTFSSPYLSLALGPTLEKLQAA